MVYKSFIAICFSVLMITPMNDEVIEWRDNLKLSWSQLKAPPKANRSAVAVTASGITFEYSVNENRFSCCGF
ncbi:MAG: hypothetical protein R2783_00335 [Gelidibacter sp.]